MHRILLLLAAVVVCHGQTLSFDVASVRWLEHGNTGFSSFSPPGAPVFAVKNVTLSVLVQLAFGVDENRISAKPGWPGSEFYDVSATVVGGTYNSYAQLRTPLQEMLKTRFGLVAHRETRQEAGYSLGIAKGGPKLMPTEGKDAMPTILKNGIEMKNCALGVLAGALARPAGRPVIDETGIGGKFDISLQYAPEGDQNSNLPSVFTALEEQLGLKLNSTKVPLEMVVIDEVKKIPTEN